MSFVQFKFRAAFARFGLVFCSYEMFIFCCIFVNRRGSSEYTARCGTARSLSWMSEEPRHLRSPNPRWLLHASTVSESCRINCRNVSTAGLETFNSQTLLYVPTCSVISPHLKIKSVRRRNRKLNVNIPITAAAPR